MRELLDTNTWIALTVETHPHHSMAQRWYEAAPLTVGDLMFCRLTEMGFLRLVTQKQVMKQCGLVALSNDEAVEYLSRVYEDPAVVRVEEPPATRNLWLELAAGPHASPHVWTDAYLAAFAIGLDAEFVTFDRGFTTYQKRGLNLLLLEST